MRLHDQPALAAAVNAGGPLIPLYILDDDTPGQWKPGAASRWWLHHSLAALDKDLRKAGSRLVIARGPALKVLTDMAGETNARALFWSRSYEPWAIKMERGLHRALEGSGVRCRRFSGSLLFEPEDIANQQGEPFRLFAPFYKACLDQKEPARAVPGAPALPPVPDDVGSEPLEALGLLPGKPDWSSGMKAAWTPGEAGARARLKTFVGKALANYATDRDMPGADRTSRLSPHLHFGEISPRQVWHAIRGAAAKNGDAHTGTSAGAEAFLRELVWREFSAHLLFHWPHIPTTPFNNRFSDFPWIEDGEALKLWRQGRTGYPIVDAGMRELWATGWMHNRVRMITASFLVKDLLIHWQRGEEWFWDTLVDADLANNAASWQWVAGSGADAAPWFRIFNPVLQGKKFDPDGAYVQSWVPELKKMPRTHIHSPWTASAAALKKAGVTLGETYPKPMVDHAAARKRALAAFEAMKENG